MMFNEIKSGDIPSLSFLKGTNYAMYIGPELNLEQVQLLRSDNIPVPVLYLPEILEQLSDSVLKYNFPGVSMPENFCAETIYEQIRSEFEGRLAPESRLIVKYDGDVLVIYDAKENFSLVISYLINMCAPPAPRKVKHARCIIGKDVRYFEELINECRSLDTEESYKQPLSFRTVTEESTAENTFNAEMNKAFKEAEEVIKNLLLKGCPPKMILALINQHVKISRLKITKQFRIFLTDYDNMEIEMRPLPKTVFLFYLRHPEGVMFTYLQNYKEELKEIYGRVCKNDDPEKMEESINRLINPFDNSICEKCANVKRAFLLKMADEFAANYYIRGAQGEKKGISLDRNLVEWECEL
jgi:hypothetical protein